jgi:hypothetical protein
MTDRRTEWVDFAMQMMARDGAITLTEDELDDLADTFGHLGYYGPGSSSILILGQPVAIIPTRRHRSRWISQEYRREHAA